MKAGLLIALLVAVTGQILYHVTQKMVASGANPVLSSFTKRMGAGMRTACGRALIQKR